MLFGISQSFRTLFFTLLLQGIVSFPLHWIYLHFFIIFFPLSSSWYNHVFWEDPHPKWFHIIKSLVCQEAEKFGPTRAFHCRGVYHCAVLCPVWWCRPHTHFLWEGPLLPESQCTYRLLPRQRNVHKVKHGCAKHHLLSSNVTYSFQIFNDEIVK